VRGDRLGHEPGFNVGVALLGGLASNFLRRPARVFIVLRSIVVVLSLRCRPVAVFGIGGRPIAVFGIGGRRGSLYGRVTVPSASAALHAGGCHDHADHHAQYGKADKEDRGNGLNAQHHVVVVAAAASVDDRLLLRWNTSGIRRIR